MIFLYLTGLVERQVWGYNIIFLLGITKSARSIIMHILFCVCASNFAEPEICGILGDLHLKRSPKYVHITPLHLEWNNSFLQVLREEFEAFSTEISITPDGTPGSYAR